MNIIYVWVVSICGFLFSMVNFILGKYLATKILKNDLLHLTVDVKDLKAGEKEYRKDLKNELNKIFRRLGRIEKNQVKRDTICEERHKKD